MVTTKRIRSRPPAAGIGRKAGVPNRATADAREAFRLLLSNNLEAMQDMIDRLARKNPARALDTLLRLAEFVVPKLASTQATVELSQNSDRPVLSLGDFYAATKAAKARPVVGDFAETVRYVTPPAQPGDPQH